MMYLRQFALILNFNNKVLVTYDSLYITGYAEKTELEYINILCDEFGFEIIEELEKNDKEVILKIRKES